MKNSLKKYLPFGIGALIASLGFWWLEAIDFIKVPKDSPLELLFLFLIWTFLIGLPIYKFNFLKRHKSTVYKVLFLIGLLILLIFISDLAKTPDSPIVIPLLILFCLGVLHVALPSFFKKYRLPVLILYGLVTLYFLYVRLFTNYFELHHENIINMIFIPIPIIVLLWLFEQWKWFQKLKSDKTKAELSLLRNQINPHFFFNTLNNLYALSITKSEKAPDVILKLSDIMRYTIYEGNKEKVALKDEIKYLENYIDLHTIRQNQKAKISFNHRIDNDYFITPLLLIILLENAFKHGVEMMTKNAFIHVDLVAKNDQIRFAVKNNFEEKSETESKGIGLANLKKRLSILYPKSHTLKIVKKDGIFSVDLQLDIK